MSGSCRRLSSNLSQNSFANLAAYTEEHIKSLDWREHIRTRPGMYTGR